MKSGTSGADEEEWECLAGCGCRCLEHEFVGLNGRANGDDDADNVRSDERLGIALDDGLEEGWESLGFRSLGRGVSRLSIL